MNILKFLWRGMAEPGAWLVLMLMVLISDTTFTTGSISESGKFWFGLFVLLFYLSLIANLLSEILEKLPTKEE